MRRLLALTCVLALVAFACGDDDATDTTTAGETTTTAAPTTTAAVTTTAAETTTTEATVDLADPAGWPLTAPDLVLPVTFVDGIGNEVTVTSVDRIGSMYGTASEILWTLGLGDRIVVIEGTTQYPAELAALPNVGFFRALPAEGILAEAPEVLFVSPDAGPPEVLESLEAAGVVVVRLPAMTADIGSFEAIVDMLGVAVGAPDHAAALADALVAAYDEVAMDAPDDAPVVLYAVARGQNVFLTGLDSPSNTFIGAAGFTSAAAVLGLETSAPLTPEAIVVADPAVIITTASSAGQAGGPDAFMAMPGIAESTAGLEGALIVWDDDAEIQQWTPRTPGMLLELRERLAGLTG